MFGFYDKYFLFFGLEIYYYGCLIAFGMAMGILIACKTAKKRGLKTEDILILACYILPLSIIGARLYFITFDPHHNILDFFNFRQGGMAIYGGIIGGALGVVLFCLIHKKNFFDVVDIAVVPLLFGQGIGRIGCYFSECCYGIEVSNEALQWFPLCTNIDGVWRLSTFFYESFCDFVLCGIFLFLILRKVETRGVMFSLYLICYGAIRCIIEGFRGESLMLGAVRVSQILSGLLVAAGIVVLIVLLVNKKKNNRKNKR